VSSEMYLLSRVSKALRSLVAINCVCTTGGPKAAAMTLSAWAILSSDAIDFGLVEIFVWDL
jgi:hypothetical protein